ncbi:MAG: OmpA/MotB family protein [Bacteroidota bacterium]|jgi:chemotaxis protein MotB
MNYLWERPSRSREDAGHWKVSYIDLLTAMIAAFTLLLAISKPDQSKLDVFAADAGTGKIRQENLSTIAHQLNETVSADTVLRKAVTVVMTGDGVEVRFLSNLLFPIGKATLVKDGYNAMIVLAPHLKKFIESRNAFLSIEGHTDDQPLINGKEFQTNWELSAARSLQVLKFLQDSSGIERKRLSAVGFADTRPAQTATDSVTRTYTENARAHNRRVVIRIYYYSSSGT